MTELVEEIKVEASNTQTIEYFVYYILGAIEIILVFRFVLKLLGASLASGFVRFVYSFGGVFISPFEGIFRRAVAPGVETASVFEPATIVAMIVYAILAWGIVKLVRISSGEKQVN
jgi:hypothetical protein